MITADTDTTASAADAPTEDAPASIFAETDDATPAPPPEPPPVDEKHERLTSVKALAAQVKAAAQERQQLAYERQQGQRERAQLIEEVQRARSEPWEYAKQYGWNAQRVAEAELLQGSDQSAAERAERLAMQTQKQLDDVLNHVRTTQEREQRIQAWDQARAAAVKEYSSGASKWPDLTAFVDRTAKKTGQSTDAVLVDELLHTVDRVRKDPRFSAYADKYSDGEYLAFMNERLSGFGGEKPAAKSYRNHSDGDTHTKPTAGAPFGSAAHRRQEAAEIVAAWRAAKNETPAVPSKPYTQAEIDTVERTIVGEGGRVNKAADRKHSMMISHNARLGRS